MKNYYAKSNPLETIQEHTNKLIKNLLIIKDIYPQISINWNLLKDAVIYHDLGKINLKFQNRILTGKKNKSEIAHNFLSLCFLNINELLKKYSEEEIKILANSIAYHHDRGEYDPDCLEDEIELLRCEIKNFKYDKINLNQINKISRKYFSNNRIYEDNVFFYDYIKIKGLLNRLDYAASANIDVEIKNNFLLEGLQNLGYKWNKLQNFMLQHKDENVVITAQTGIGKTEAGLLWIGNNKGFYTLPIKTAINEIYKRVINRIIKNPKYKKFVGVLHSETLNQYILNKIEQDDPFEHYLKTRQLSLPLTICTLDQIFNFVFKYRGFEPLLATLMYSKIVIDEIQMYSSDLLAYLIVGLYYITKIGGKFAILTATLPEIIVDLLKEEGITFIMPNKCYIKNNFIRHSLKVENCNISSNKIIELYNNNKILVICNTVKKAQELYIELKENKSFINRCRYINLIHSRFIKKHRKEKEQEIVEFGKTNNGKKGIWISTQIVEASLDIDFDILITELSDLNSLFQRMGRCYRNREFKGDGYNCYVFNGGDNQTTGVGKIIDKRIFEISKEALKNINGIITEEQKVNLIKNNYTKEKLENTDYYKDIIENIKYLKSLYGYEFNKSDVIKKFRNIYNISIIPNCVYQIYKNDIDDLYKSITTSKNKEEEIILFEKLSDFTVDVNYLLVEKKRPVRILSFKNRNIPIYNGFQYDKYSGLKISKESNYLFNNIDENFIG